MKDPRWATFECYGTLVDWNAGIRAELDRLFGAAAGDALLPHYHVIEPRVQGERPAWSYREVMAAVLAELASEAGVELSADDRDALAGSRRLWRVWRTSSIRSFRSGSTGEGQRWRTGSASR